MKIAIFLFFIHLIQSSQKERLLFQSGFTMNPALLPFQNSLTSQTPLSLFNQK
jgi:hypothetical protein